MKQYILPFSLTADELTLIEQRLAEFTQVALQDSTVWFSELCFCLLTANSQAKKAIAIQKEITPQGFVYKTEQELASIIKAHKHRFHNVKARYIVQARTYSNIKDILQTMTSLQALTFLVKQVKGLGYKEASHFLRNVGYHDRAIIDRHIIKFLFAQKYIDKIPTSITPHFYLVCEEILKKFGIPLDKLDLMIWYYMTGTVLK
jgi:N-glycosylase/DNA lyase